GREPDRVGVEHGAAAMTWKAEPVAVDDVDITASNRVALLEHACAFVGKRGRDARDDLVVVFRMTRDATPGSLFCGDVLHEWIGNACTAAGVAPIPPRARL